MNPRQVAHIFLTVAASTLLDIAQWSSKPLVGKGDDRMDVDWCRFGHDRLAH